MLIGFAAVITLEIREDTGLLVAGLIATALIIFRDKITSGSVASVILSSNTV